MITEQLKMIILAVISSVVLSAFVCFLLFFNNRTVDEDLPQYLIHSIGNYVVTEDDGVSLNNEGLQRLKSHDLWLIVLDGSNNPIYETGAPDEYIHRYSGAELVDAALRTNENTGYTVFVGAGMDDEYTLLLGCDSTLATKQIITIGGSRSAVLGKIIAVFLIVSAVMTALCIWRLSKKVTTPISQAMTDIELIGGRTKEEIALPTDKNFFSDIFVSIKNLQARLAENDKLRAEWIANLSHDIKTPLSTIRGYAEMLSSEDYTFSEEEVRRYGAEICKAQDIINGYINDLKVSQMLEEGKVQLQLEPVMTAELLEECINDITTSLTDASEITFNPESKAVVDVDRNLMKRAFENILANAFVHNSAAVTVCVSLVDKVDTVVIQISDNGKGMDKETAAHIFERYYRGMDSSKVKGTGLGLAIARETILLHGGEIDVESEVGKGTLFTVQLKKP